MFLYVQLAIVAAQIGTLIWLVWPQVHVIRRAKAAHMALRDALREKQALEAALASLGYQVRLVVDDIDPNQRITHIALTRTDKSQGTLQ